MKTEDLKAGLYILNHDVQNPIRDKRMKRDWREDAVWAKGTMFCVYMDSFERENGKALVIPRLHKGRNSRGESMYARQYRDEPTIYRWENLVSALEPAPESLDNWLAQNQAQGSENELLETMLECGMLTYAQLDQALKLAETKRAAER